MRCNECRRITNDDSRRTSPEEKQEETIQRRQMKVHPLKSNDYSASCDNEPKIGLRVSAYAASCLQT
jgi:hypothetical protein